MQKNAQTSKHCKTPKDLQSISKEQEACSTLQGSAFKLRWRVKEGKVLLFNRHIRELKHFAFTPALVAWVHERLEWAVVNLLASTIDAVLELHVDPAAEIKLCLEDTRVLPVFSLDDLSVDEEIIQGLSTCKGVWPATVWLVSKEGLLTACTTELFLAVDTLAAQLAHTQNEQVLVEQQHSSALSDAQAVFALSDEFGFIPLLGSSTLSDKLASNLAKLFSLPSSLF